MELLVVVAILAILSVALLPSVLGYSDKARDTRAAKDIRNFNTVVEAFAAANGNYPEASLDNDNPRSIASIMQSKGVNWTGDATGKTDPWGNPYYYDVVDDYYCIASAGKDGTLNTADDICNIGGKVSKKASGLDGNAIPSAVPGNNPGGGGPEHLTEVPEGYIGIYTPGELASIGNDPKYPLNGNYIVMDDLDLSGYSNWNPIGNYGADSESKFTGTFNGNNYVISNLKISRPDTNHQGLFGRADGGKIENLGLENVDITGRYRIGGLVGWNYGGTITNCYATGKVTGDSYTGGLVGSNKGSLTNCYATGTVKSSANYVGGLVGENSGTITNCYATGEVTGNDRTGGLVGQNDGTITNCYATGSVSGGSCTGGLVGYNSTGCAIENCYATGSVSGNNNDTGGLVGCNVGSITNSYATGSVEGDYYTGGLVGENYGIITDCYATGKVTGYNEYTGGLVGWNDEVIKNCYATGSVTGDSETGGLVGYNNVYATVDYSYYDTETTGQSDTGKGILSTTAEMKDSARFSKWDFNTVWGIDEGVSYPYLQTNEQIPHPGSLE